MNVLLMFTMYVVLTALGLITARVIIYVTIGRHAMPDRPERAQLPDCASESLRRATELRLDATAVYKQISGKV